MASKVLTLCSKRCSTSDLIQTTERIMEQRKIVFDKIASLKPTELVYSTVLKPICNSDYEYEAGKRVVVLLQMLHPNKEIREMSRECGKKLAEFDVDIAMRRDVFYILQAYRACSDSSKLPTEFSKYLDRQINIGKRNGLHLSSDVQQEVKNVMKRMNELCIEFQRNMSEDATTFEFTRVQLDGVPESFLSSLDKTELGHFQVTLKYPHYFPCMKRCRVPETRAALEKAFSSIAKCKNTLILEELVALRSKHAKLLQYPSHAAFQQELWMAKSPQTVLEFLNDLCSKLQGLKQQEMDTLLKYKEKECMELSIEYDGKLKPSDLRYYMTMVEERDYNVNHEKLREYFPMEVVTKGLLQIYQHLLGLIFTQLDETARDNVGLAVWHEDVDVYEVKDSSGGEVLGYFYLDLYPRDGKFRHMIIEQMQFGCSTLSGDVPPDTSDDTRHVAIAVMLTNFTKPTKDKPSLLEHSELKTYFHEFGHIMHHICTKAQLTYYSGTMVALDFKECPSQMLENWCWEEESLRLMSGHYLTGERIPREMLEKLVLSRRANTGLMNARQIAVSLFDLRIHSVPASTKCEVDVVEEYSKVCEEVWGIPATPGTSFPASFQHIVDVKSGMDAGYYSYLWSEVFSMDMFASKFKKEGVMNEATGRHYRTHILEPGGSKSGNDTLRDFLGREPSNEAFFSSIGIA